MDCDDCIDLGETGIDWEELDESLDNPWGGLSGEWGVRPKISLEMEWPEESERLSMWVLRPFNHELNGLIVGC